jgi:hypothetical protein
MVSEDPIISERAIAPIVKMPRLMPYTQLLTTTCGHFSFLRHLDVEDLSNRGDGVGFSCSISCYL